MRRSLGSIFLLEDSPSEMVDSFNFISQLIAFQIFIDAGVNFELDAGSPAAGVLRG